MKYFAANRYEGCRHNHKTRKAAQRCADSVNKRTDTGKFKVYTRIAGKR